MSVGGFGLIYRATIKSLGIKNKEVVLKCVLTTRQDDYDAQKSEAEAMILLKHPNIMPLLDHGIIESKKRDGSPMHLHILVLPMYDGDLKSLLNARDLSFLETNVILKSSASALAYIHSKGWSHNDIRPQNILFKIRPFRIVLSDLGSALHSIEATDFRGLMSFASPECLSSVMRYRSYDTQMNDVWSMGVTFLYLYTKSEIKISSYTASSSRIKELQERYKIPSALTHLLFQKILVPQNQRLDAKAFNNEIKKYMDSL